MSHLKQFFQPHFTSQGCPFVAHQGRHGNCDGDSEGNAEGVALGVADGEAEGVAEGMAEGDALGVADGEAEGVAEGEAEGVALGLADGTSEHCCKNSISPPSQTPAQARASQMGPTPAREHNPPLPHAMSTHSASQAIVAQLGLRLLTRVSHSVLQHPGIPYPISCGTSHVIGVIKLATRGAEAKKSKGVEIFIVYHPPSK